MTEHSKLPWGRQCFLITSATGSHVTHTGQGNLPPSRSSESEANAAFIKRACNAHHDLLTAARAALKEMCNTTSPRHSFTDAVDLLDAAIAKAEAPDDPPLTSVI